jgi:hypothetical protein
MLMIRGERRCEWLRVLSCRVSTLLNAAGRIEGAGLEAAIRDGTASTDMVMLVELARSTAP